jgi:hypothetical protein
MATPAATPGNSETGDAPPEDGPGQREADVDAYFRDLVAKAPPLTPAQRDRLALLFSSPARTARVHAQRRPAAADPAPWCPWRCSSRRGRRRRRDR